MEDEAFERGAVARRHDGRVVDGGAHDFDARGRVRVDGGVEQAVVDFVGDERAGEAAEVLFERGGDGVDVEVGVGDVEIVGAFEAFFDLLDLRVTSGFSIDAFNVHAYERSQFGSFVKLRRKRGSPLSSTWSIHDVTMPGMCTFSYSARCSSSEPNKTALTVSV